MQRMYFRDGRYHEGMNLTVRYGKYWYSRLKPGDKVIFWKTDTKIDKRPIMEIHDVWYGYLMREDNMLPPAKGFIKELHHANYSFNKIKNELEKMKPNCTKEKITFVLFMISNSNNVTRETIGE